MNPRSTIREARKTLPLLPCACANLRRAARAVTRLYNQELRSEHIEITQFTLLMALNQTGEIPQGELGKLLALDSTTLTRMLELLKNRGWVLAQEGDDRRYRIYRLTSAGREKLQHSMRHWQRAQDRLRASLGDKTMAQLTGLLPEIAALSSEP